MPSYQNRDVSRTLTGLLLMIISFGLAWIPYINAIGGLLAIIGIIFVWLGRGAFSAAHHRFVNGGAACILLGFLLVVVATIWLTVEIVAAVSAFGSTPSTVGATLQGALASFFVIGLVSAGLVALGHVLLPYGLTNERERLLLWGAFVLVVALGAVNAALIWPQISSAIATATSGSTINTAPLDALQTRSTLFGILAIVPDLMFLWVYYRARQRILPPQAVPAAPLL